MNEHGFSRRNWLEELLIGVFTVKYIMVLSKYKKHDFPVVFQQDWYKRVKCNDASLLNYNLLFKRALIDSDTVYFNSSNNQRKDLNKNHIIENAKKYFGSYGYSEGEYTRKYSTDDIGRLFYKIIIKIIFPIIFEAGMDMDDDISHRYKNIKERITYLFSNPDLDDFFYIDARNQDIEKIIDYDLMGDDSKADIAIPIETSFMTLVTVIHWYNTSVDITIKPADYDFKVWSERTDLSLDELMEKWIKYPYNPKAHFEKPWDPSRDRFDENIEQGKNCPITTTEIKHFEVLPLYIFFITNSRFFKKCSSYKEMKDVIIERLKKTILSKHDTEFYSYYKSVADEIKEMISIIKSADINRMIEHDKESYTEIVRHFNLEPKELYKSCSFNRKNDIEIIDEIYNMLEKAIYSFASNIKNKSRSLVIEFKDRIPSTTIKHLMDTIDNYINDNRFIESIQMLDDRLKEDRDKYYPEKPKTKGSSFLDSLNTIIPPEENYLKYLKVALQEFYDCLNDDNNDECQLNTEEEVVASENSKEKDYFKKLIDEQIELLKKPLIGYLKSKYKMIMYIYGKGAQFTKADYNEYDKLKIQLSKTICLSTPFYDSLIEIDKKLKELIDANAEINDDVFNTIIETNLCNFKQSLYSYYKINDEDHNEKV